LVKIYRLKKKPAILQAFFLLYTTKKENGLSYVESKVPNNHDRARLNNWEDSPHKSNNYLIIELFLNHRKPDFYSLDVLLFLKFLFFGQIETITFVHCLFLCLSVLTLLNCVWKVYFGTKS